MKLAHINDFKSAHKRYIDALKYIMENEEKLKADPVKWARVQDNFEAKFSIPMDAAWKALTDAEQKRLLPIYLHRKSQTDPTVKKVMEVFDAEITGEITLNND